MQPVRFLRDFRSIHTREQFYAAGAETSFDLVVACLLANEGAVELLAPQPMAASEPPPSTVSVAPAPAPVAPPATASRREERNKRKRR